MQLEIELYPHDRHALAHYWKRRYSQQCRELDPQITIVAAI